MIFFLKNNTRPFICLALAVTTLAVYWPVQNFPFIYYDDDEYVYDNPRVQKGLSISNFLWSFQTKSAANWHPVTWLSLMLDTDLFGNSPGGYHLTNLFLHILNALLLFLLLSKLTKSPWRSAFVSFLFALHPVHVESVAWISERKDLLCMLFMLLTIGAYSDYAATRRLPAYYRALIYFAVGLMAKPMLVTLPLVLLLLDIWPLGRILPHPNASKEKMGLLALWQERRSLLLEKVPFLLLSIISCFITLCAQKASGAVADFPLDQRVANAVISYLLYLKNTVYPAHLAFFYPFPSIINTILVAVSVLILGGISIAAIKSMRRVPWFFSGWFWYIITLLPVIGIIQVGAQSMADRYTYIPLIGIFIILAWGMAFIFASSFYQKLVVVACALYILAAISVIARKQVELWQDSASLFRHALASTDRNHVAHNNLGKVFFLQNRLDSAKGHFSEAIKILPNYSIAYYNLGYVLKQQGNLTEAIPLFQKAIAYDPDYLHAYQCLAEIYDLLGKDTLTAVYSHKALILNRNSFSSWFRLGKVFLNRNAFDTALLYFDSALTRCPSCWEVHYYLGLAYLRKQQPDSCFYHLSYSLHLNPTSWNLYNSIGQELFARGQVPVAIRMYSRAITLAPAFEKPYLSRGIAFTIENKLDSAVLDFQNAVRIKPNLSDAHFYLGQIFERMGIKDSVNIHFREAARLDSVNPVYNSKLRTVRQLSNTRK